MRTTFNINFYCRESKKDRTGLAAVEMGINLNGKRVFINLPLKFKPEEFNRKRRSAEIEESLTRWRSKVNMVINELMDEGQPLTVYTIRDAVKTGGVKSYTVEDLFNDYLKILRARDMTGGSYRKYELTKELFIEYMKDSDVTKCRNSDRQLISIKDSDISGFYEWMKERYQTNSSASYMAKLKSFFKYGIDSGKIRKNPFTEVKIRRERKQIEYLTDIEIEKIRNTEYSTKALNRIKDVFLVQTYTGLSFIDLENLREEDIKFNGNLYYVSKLRQKTKIRYTAVIIEEGIEILKKYNYRLPIISNQKTNSALKAIAREAGVDKNVYTHLARKTYGHILLKRGVRIEAVAKALGHSEIKTTQRYYAELNEESILKEFEFKMK